jgi:UDP-N-acetylglucosamine transferase subunit ALG13
VSDAPLVFVSVGTDHHPFDRLLQWMAAWDGEARVLVQSGATAPVAGIECRDFLPAPEMDAVMAEAAAVVGHGGPGTIMQARAAGHLPIVVPRRPELGEHVDGHQVRFATWMAARGHVVVVETDEELHSTLDRVVAHPESFRLPSVADDDTDEISRRFGVLVDSLARYRPR